LLSVLFECRTFINSEEPIRGSIVFIGIDALSSWLPLGARLLLTVKSLLEAALFLLELPLFALGCLWVQDFY
jgi:hypothetical protein